MAIGRTQRRDQRRPAVVDTVGPTHAEAVLDLLALVDLAWHDCYGEPAPPDRVVADILMVGGESLAELIGAAHLAVIDWRDLRVNAQAAADEHRIHDEP